MAIPTYEKLMLPVLKVLGDNKERKAIDRIEERFGRNKIKVGFTNKDVPNKQGFMTSPTMIY